MIQTQYNLCIKYNFIFYQIHGNPIIISTIVFNCFPFIFLLGNDLDSIRALFSEKEKELSLAVAKVEALTKQLEEIRRDRRGPLNLINGLGTGAGSAINVTNSIVTSNGLSINSTNNIGSNSNNSTSAARELDKLRRELMVSIRN